MTEKAKFILWMAKLQSIYISDSERIARAAESIIENNQEKIYRDEQTGNF